MRVLAISSSPRKGGNSDVLCDQFLKGAGEAGHETEKVRLAEMNLAPCIGCYQCGKAQKCIHEDGMEELLQNLIGADVIVLATPVYFYSMSAQMKIFIDRCLQTLLRRLHSLHPRGASRTAFQRSPGAESLSGKYRRV